MMSCGMLLRCRASAPSAEQSRGITTVKRLQYGAHHRGFDSRDAENCGAKRDTARIFETGRQKRHQTAGRPTRLQIRRIRERPALKDDDQQAAWHSSADGQNRRIQKTSAGPRTIPVISIPIIAAVCTAADTGRRQTDER